MSECKRPMLSVCLVTYNHEKYIKECLDSILNQKVSFDVEILVGNDCSTDRTAEVLKEYGDKIEAINREHNLGLCANIKDLFLRAKGKYVFLFSGDDFLCRDDVFFRQVNFLEKNPEYFSVSARNYTYIQGENKWTEHKIKCGKYTMYDFLLNPHFPCAHGTIRNYFTEDRENIAFFSSGARNNEEIKLWVYCLDKGEKYIIDECMHVYRYIKQEGEGNYCSKKTYLDIFQDYYGDLKMVEKIYGNKYNFRPLKILFMNKFCIMMSGDVLQLLQFLGHLNIADIFTLLLYKIYLKFHHYQMPAKWLTEKYLIKDRG